MCVSSKRTYCGTPCETLGCLVLAFIVVAAPGLDGVHTALVVLRDRAVEFTVDTHAILFLESDRLVKPEKFLTVTHVKDATCLRHFFPSRRPHS